MAKKPTVTDFVDSTVTGIPESPDVIGGALDLPCPPKDMEEVTKWREEGERIAKAFDRKHLARQFAATIFSFKGFTVNEKTLPEQAYKYADAFLAYEAEIGA